MEHLPSRVKAAERATRKAKEALDEARDKRSRISAKLYDYEDRLHTVRRGREYDTLREKCDTLKERLLDSQEQIRRALDAHAELSENSLDLFHRMVEAENASKSKRTRSRHDERKLQGSGSTTRRTYTTHTTYHHGPSRREQSSSDEKSNHRPRHGRVNSFEEFTRPRNERQGSRDSRNRSGHYDEHYSTEEHVPRPHHRHRHESPDSSDDEEDFMTDDRRSYHPSYTSQDNAQCFTTEERVPRSQRPQQGEETNEARRHYYSWDHSPRAEGDYFSRNEPNHDYSTEEHRPNTAYRSNSNDTEPKERRHNRDDGHGEHAGRSTPHPHPHPHPQHSHGEGYARDRSNRSDSHRHRPDVPQTPTKLPSQQIVDSWWKYVNHCFQDYSKITQFPIPPALSCGKPDCDATRANRPMAACECAIRASFGMVPNFNVKRERLRWHPDKFAACPANLREGFQKMASEVFIVLDKMYQEKQ